MLKAVYKVPGGKLIKLSLEKEDEVIKSIKITGDFFLYPEDSLVKIENAIKGEKIADLPERLKDLVQKEKIEFFGINVDAIMEAIRLAK